MHHRYEHNTNVIQLPKMSHSHAHASHKVGPHQYGRGNFWDSLELSKIKFINPPTNQTATTSTNNGKSK